tara:strand:+ start:173 stop:601 length:429 start_codon:yes stop_codon:yes gene_type:complete
MDGNDKVVMRRTIRLAGYKKGEFKPIGEVIERTKKKTKKKTRPDMRVINWLNLDIEPTGVAMLGEDVYFFLEKHIDFVFHMGFDATSQSGANAFPPGSRIQLKDSLLVLPKKELKKIFSILKLPNISVSVIRRVAEMTRDRK